MDNKIKNYWDERATQNQKVVTGTTNDIYLRELEIRTFTETLRKLGIQKNNRILDVGCGDGYTTLNIANSFPESYFIGIDYSENMIANAQMNLTSDNKTLANVDFKVADATNIQQYFEGESFDFILSDRCLINLEKSEIQYETISKICSLLKPGGYYLAVENFVEGQNNLNEAREKMGLDPISIRWHNRFFNEDEYLKYTTKWFSDVDFVEFSSAYYYATRIIYSAMCKLQGSQPDYNHDIHKVSIDLPIIGKYSPIRLAILKK